MVLERDGYTGLAGGEGVGGRPGLGGCLVHSLSSFSLGVSLASTCHLPLLFLTALPLGFPQKENQDTWAASQIPEEGSGSSSDFSDPAVRAGHLHASTCETRSTCKYFF